MPVELRRGGHQAPKSIQADHGESPQKGTNAVIGSESNIWVPDAGPLATAAAANDVVERSNMCVPRAGAGDRPEMSAAAGPASTASSPAAMIHRGQRNTLASMPWL